MTSRNGGLLYCAVALMSKIEGQTFIITLKRLLYLGYFVIDEKMQ